MKIRSWFNTPQQPQPDDAVLGGQYQAPIDGAVLGGMEGVRQRLASDNLEIKKVALTQALNCGEKGLEFLFEVLEKEKKDVQWLAYQLLESSSKKDLSWWDKLQGKTSDDSLSDSLKRQIRKRLKNYFPCYEYESVTVNRRGEIIQRSPGKARYYREDLGEGIYLDMTYIPGGTFMMGAPVSEQHSRDNERPQHQVKIPPFWMGKYAVTQEQYQAVVGRNPSHFKGAKRPVERVSWNDCESFCQKLSQRTGKAYGLPSEAQWEYGCRAGTITPFHCGETITTNLANYNVNNGKNTYAETVEVERFLPHTFRGETVEVGQFPPNAFGLYEMHGNVQEWCGDGWHYSYDDKPKKLQQNGSIIWSSDYNSRHVMRGGHWFYPPGSCRSANRVRYGADKNYTFGFRLAVSPS